MRHGLISRAMALAAAAAATLPAMTEAQAQASGIDTSRPRRNAEWHKQHSNQSKSARRKAKREIGHRQLKKLNREIVWAK